MVGFISKAINTYKSNKKQKSLDIELIAALEEHNYTVAKKTVLQGADVNANHRDFLGLSSNKSPILTTLKKDDTKMLGFLKEHGLDINQVAKNENICLTPALHCLYNGYAACLESLLKDPDLNPEAEGVVYTPDGRGGRSVTLSSMVESKRVSKECMRLVQKFDYVVSPKKYCRPKCDKQMELNLDI